MALRWWRLSRSTAKNRTTLATTSPIATPAKLSVNWYSAVGQTTSRIEQPTTAYADARRRPYATSSGRPSTTTAYFDWFDYERG